MRIDQLLVQRGLASTRSQAQRLIADGVQWQKMEVGGQVWKRVVKNGDDVPEDAAIELLDDSEARYVSRGGLKLEAALKHALQVTYQLEDNELAAELLPAGDAPRVLLLYESAEGGAG